MSRLPIDAPQRHEALRLPKKIAAEIFARARKESEGGKSLERGDVEVQLEGAGEARGLDLRSRDSEACKVLQVQW